MAQTRCAVKNMETMIYLKIVAPDASLATSVVVQILSLLCGWLDWIILRMRRSVESLHVSIEVRVEVSVDVEVTISSRRTEAVRPLSWRTPAKLRLARVHWRIDDPGLILDKSGVKSKLNSRIAARLAHPSYIRRERPESDWSRLSLKSFILLVNEVTSCSIGTVSSNPELLAEFGLVFAVPHNIMPELILPMGKLTMIAVLAGSFLPEVPTELRLEPRIDAGAGAHVQASQVISRIRSFVTDKAVKQK